MRVKWRKDSTLNDRGNNGEDLTGGYFDGNTSWVDFTNVFCARFSYDCLFLVTFCLVRMKNARKKRW